MSRLWLLCSLILVGAARGQETSQPIERLVPAEAFFALSTDDAQRAGRQFEQAPLGKMLASDEWQPFLAALRESPTGAPLHLRPWFGIDWAELAELPLPASLCALPDGNKQPALVLVIDAAKQPQAAEKLRERATAYFEGRQTRIVEEKVASGQRIVFSLGDGKAARETIFLSRNSAIALVTSRAAADAIQKLWEAKEPASLAALPQYQQVQKEAASLKGGGEVRWWLRPLELVQHLPRKAAAERRRGERVWQDVMEKQGIGGLKAAGGSIRFAADAEAGMELSLAAIAPRPYQRALALASLAAGPVREPPPWAAASVTSWSIVYRDVPKWFDGIGAVFDERADPSAPPGAFRDFLDQLEFDDDGPKVDVRGQIVPRLKPGLMQLADFGAAKTDWNPTGRRALFLLDARETAELEKAFKRFFAPDAAVTSKVVAGHTLWRKDAGETLFLDEPGEEKEVSVTSLAVTGDAVLLSTDESWLVAALEAKAPATPLKGSPPFAAALKYLQARESPETSLRSIERSGESWRRPYEAIRKGEAAEEGDAGRALLQLVLFGSAKADPKLGGQLPPWDAAGPYVGTMAISLRVSPAGFWGSAVQIAE